MNLLTISISLNVWLSHVAEIGRSVVASLVGYIQASTIALKKSPSTHWRPSHLHVEEIRHIDDVARLEPVWNNLLDQHERPIIFLTYEWFIAWWKCLGGNGKELLILVVKDEDEILGIAPFMEVHETFFGLPITKIEFISTMKYADAPANCSATLDMIIGKRHAEVVSAVINHLAHHHRRWDFLRFNPLNEHSLTPSLIEREALRHGYRFNKHPVFANAYIYVTADWNHYRLQVSARARKALAAYDRKLRELGVVTYEEFRTVEEIENRFNDLLSIEQRSWKWDVGVSINSVVFRDFYQVFAEDASRKGLLRLWMLKVNDKYIAYDYSAVFKGYLVSLKTSYDEAYRKYNPGNLLTWHEFEYFINGGIKRINLLWGDVKAKERWLTELESHYEVFVFNTSVYSRFLRMLFFSLSFYRIRRIIIDYRNRIARKAGLRLTESELTRSDQVKHRGVKIQSINQDAQIATTMTSMNTTKIHTEIKKQDTTVPVVVLKSFHHLGLGVVRSLGRLGIPVYGIDPNPLAPGLHSRYCRERFIWDVDNASQESTVNFLLDVGKKLGKRSILINTADETALLRAEYANVLSEWYIFPRLSPTLIQSLTSKKEMYYLAKEHCVPTAETAFPRTRDDVLQYLDHVAFPVMLKGIDGQLLEKRAGKKMVIIKNKKDLLDHYDRMEDPEHPNLMLQEYLPGGDDTVWMFNGYFNENSDCLFAITGKKIRQAPVYTGYTSLGICLPNPTVEQMTKDFMKKIGYRGILDIGYRYDARDGKYKVLDINPRIGATFRLFVAENGMDVARAKYLDLTGQTVPHSSMREGRKWFVEDRDIVSSIRYFRDKNLTVRQWLKSFRGVQEAAWFAPDDVFPFLLMCWELIRKLFKRSVRFPLAHFFSLTATWMQRTDHVNNGFSDTM